MCEENGWKFCGKFCRKKRTRVHRIRPYCDRQMREKSILFSTQRKQKWDEIVAKTTHNSLHFTNSRKRWRCGDEVQHFSTRAQTQACVRWWVEWEYLNSTSCPLLLMEEEKTTRLCAYLKSSRLFSDVDAPLSYSSSSRLVVYPDCCYSWLPHISLLRELFTSFLMLLETTTKQPNDLVHPLMPLPHSLTTCVLSFTRRVEVLRFASALSLSHSAALALCPPPHHQLHPQSYARKFCAVFEDFLNQHS